MQRRNSHDAHGYNTILLRPNNAQCNDGKGMLMPQWNAMMEKGVLLQLFHGKNEQILVKQ